MGPGTRGLAAIGLRPFLVAGLEMLADGAQELVAIHLERREKRYTAISRRNTTLAVSSNWRMRLIESRYFIRAKAMRFLLIFTILLCLECAMDA